MKTNNIIIHAIEISNNAKFGINCHTFSPSVYRGNYYATLQGNVLTVQHKEYDFISYSFALSYNLSNTLFQAYTNTSNPIKAHQILQRIAHLKAMQLVKEVNRGI